MKRATRNGVDTTAQWKALRATGRCCAIELFDVELVTLGYPLPLTLRWAEWEHDIPFESLVYAGGNRITVTSGGEQGARVLPGKTKESIGVEVDTMDLQLMLDGNDTLPPADGNALTPRFGLGEAVGVGLFEGAHVRRRTLFLPEPPRYPVTATSIDDSAGAIIRFKGRITESSLKASLASLSVKSDLEKLAIGMPRHVYQAGCRWTLYDGMCRIRQDGTSPLLGAGIKYRCDGEVISVTSPTELVIDTTSAPVQPPANWFQFGSLRFTSGVLAGISRGVRSNTDDVTSATVKLLTPLPRTPAVGDTVRLQAGCPKTRDACIGKFGNFPRFGGFATVPPADTAI